MMWLYVLEVVVIVIAAMGAGLLAVAADRAWEIHQARRRGRMVFVTITADVAGFVAAMKRAGESVADLRRAMELPDDEEPA